MFETRVMTEILGIKVIDVAEKLYKNRLYYKIENNNDVFGERKQYINVYELLYKCDKWAKSFGYKVYNTHAEIEEDLSDTSDYCSEILSNLDSKRHIHAISKNLQRVQEMD